MNFYSTKNKNKHYSLHEAVLKGLPDDNGLFMPEYFPQFTGEFLKAAPELSFPEIAYETARTFLTDSIDPDQLRKIVYEAINFDAPLVEITDRLYALELFHGPTLAFKDFGARFMAGLMNMFVKNQKKKLTILVATSGDTGGAVASGFYKKEGIEVIILYPSGKVSALQEKQLTTHQQNITAIEVNGTFDDCQRLVKMAFTDADLQDHYWLSSANSINISRLIPQTFYYVYAWSRLVKKNRPVVFCVPSGNFGNLTAGLFAKKMGLPISHFIAATNINDIVPDYLKSGKYHSKPSIQTISNAMDVGDPSNFNRMLELFNNDHEKMSEEISGFSVKDSETEETIRTVLHKYKYLLDPHGAVGFLALDNFLMKHKEVNGIFLETAHPAKFQGTVEKITGMPIILPDALEMLKTMEGISIPLSNQFDDFKDFLLSRNNF